MIDKSFNIENVLNIIFKITTKSPQIFADFYLRKDISLISRWRNNSIIPRAEDLKKIVEFILNESTEVQRLVIKDEFIKLLNKSSLKQEIKSLILEKTPFEDFLIEFLSVLTINCNLSEQAILSQPTQNKDFIPNMNIANTETYPERNDTNDVQSNISGDYTGIVKFDMVLNKKTNNKTTDNYIKELIKNISFDEKDITKLKKHLLNKITLVIALISFASFIIFQVSNNKPSNTSLGVAPSPSSSTLATPAQKTVNTVQTNVYHKNIPSTTSSPTATKPYSEAPKVPVAKSEGKNHVKPQSSSKVTKVKEHKGSKKSVSNEASNNNTNSNNFNVNITGNDNTVAVGSSSIIQRND